jgi:hypothetical protein
MRTDITTAFGRSHRDAANPRTKATRDGTYNEDLSDRIGE